MTEKTKDEKYAERMKMPILGKGIFHIGKYVFVFSIVKIGKKSITGRNDKDGCLLSISKQYVDILEECQLPAPMPQYERD
jgi:hypothetical protein